MGENGQFGLDSDWNSVGIGFSCQIVSGLPNSFQLFMKYDVVHTQWNDTDTPKQKTEITKYEIVSITKNSFAIRMPYKGLNDKPVCKYIYIQINSGPMFSFKFLDMILLVCICLASIDS